MVNHIFPSKILLFGEYTVLLGSKALAVPFPHFSGHFELFDKHIYSLDRDRQSSYKILKDLHAYIQNTIQHTDLVESFDNEKFEGDLEHGIYFHSDIPYGYGLGSSGALTAAVYHRYFKKSDKRDIPDLSVIRKHLGYIESFFHHSSSGIDPLVSYCNQPLVLQGDMIEKVNLPNGIQEQYSITLLDTEVKRLAGNLVKSFLKDCENMQYVNRIKHELVVANNGCIDAMLKRNTHILFQHLRNLSDFQLNYFINLIPSVLVPLWEKGIRSGEYYLKLCGAGGGGYLLMFSRNENQVSENNMHSLTGKYHLVPIEC